MFVGAKKDAPAKSPSSSRSQPQAFNFVGMMTRSQLTASTRKPITPLKGLSTTMKGPVAFPIMFHHEDSLYTTHMTTMTVNVTSTLQVPEVTIVGSRGSQDLLTDPPINVKNVDVREYHSDSEGEHTTTVEWRAQVESRDHRLVSQDVVLIKLKAMIE